MKNAISILFLSLNWAFGWLNADDAERPNVILIMVDDMGFSDLGYHGGEIDTPNLDALAKGGVRFSQFYNSGRCCPTRATLMTGLHPHEVGIGHMTQSPNNNRGKDRPPAYQGYLNRQCVTIAEALEGHDYATLMAGKWHLDAGGGTSFTDPKARNYVPEYGKKTKAIRESLKLRLVQGGLNTKKFRDSLDQLKISYDYFQLPKDIAAYRAGSSCLSRKDPTKKFLHNPACMTENAWGVATWAFIEKNTLRERN